MTREPAHADCGARLPPSTVRIQTISPLRATGVLYDRRQGFLLPADRKRPSVADPLPPWYYSGDLLTVEYRTDPARVAELLPAPLSLAEEDLERLRLSGRTGSRARLPESSWIRYART